MNKPKLLLADDSVTIRKVVELTFADEGVDVSTAADAATAMQQIGADHVIRLGAGRPSTGFLPLPGGGPMFTWRALNEQGMPPPPNWSLNMGDIELF